MLLSPLRLYSLYVRIDGRAKVESGALKIHIPMYASRRWTSKKLLVRVTGTRLVSRHEAIRNLWDSAIYRTPGPQCRGDVCGTLGTRTAARRLLFRQRRRYKMGPKRPQPHPAPRVRAYSDE